LRPSRARIQPAALSRAVMVLPRLILPARMMIARGIRALPFPVVLALTAAMVVVFSMAKKVIKRLRHVPLDRKDMCTECAGFGIHRCPVCDGYGVVRWEGKFMHEDPCPACFGRRIQECDMCGGMHLRNIWKHCKTSRAQKKMYTLSELEFQQRANALSPRPQRGD